MAATRSQGYFKEPENADINTSVRALKRHLFMLWTRISAEACHRLATLRRIERGTSGNFGR